MIFREALKCTYKSIFLRWCLGSLGAVSVVLQVGKIYFGLPLKASLQVGVVVCIAIPLLVFLFFLISVFFKRKIKYKKMIPVSIIMMVVGVVGVILYFISSKNVNKELILIDCFPHNNEIIRKEQIKNIYLKFNKPVERESAVYIVNYMIRENSCCQWNICGWYEFAEDDTKIIWHIHEDTLNSMNCHENDTIDYPIFEIRIGSGLDNLLRGKDGSQLPQTTISVKIEKRKLS